MNPMRCKTYSGEYCAFPFKYEGKTYDHCTNVGRHNIVGRYWCATKVDSDRNCEKNCTFWSNDWSYCHTIGVEHRCLIDSE